MTTHWKYSLDKAQVSVEMIHGLIECSQVDYDFYNVAVSPVYDMNLYIAFLFLNMLLFS